MCSLLAVLLEDVDAPEVADRVRDPRPDDVRERADGDDREHRVLAVGHVEAGEQERRLRRDRDAGALGDHQQEDPGQAHARRRRRRRTRTMRVGHGRTAADQGSCSRGGRLDRGRVSEVMRLRGRLIAVFGRSILRIISAWSTFAAVGDAVARSIARRHVSRRADGGASTLALRRAQAAEQRRSGVSSAAGSSPRAPLEVRRSSAVATSGGRAVERRPRATADQVVHDVVATWPASVVSPGTAYAPTGHGAGTTAASRLGQQRPAERLGARASVTSGPPWTPCTRAARQVADAVAAGQGHLERAQHAERRPWRSMNALPESPGMPGETV